MKKRRNFLIYPLLIMGVFLVFASSCKKDDDDNDDEPVAKVTENTKIIDQTDWQNSIVSYDTSNYIFYFNDNIAGMNLETGDIIVSAADEGILRKVSKIYDENGMVTVQTDNADLEDAIENGEFVIEQPLTISDVKSFDYHYEGISLDPSCLKQLDNTNFIYNVDAVIYDADGIENGTSDQIRLKGKFSCSWDIYMNVKISWMKLKKVRIGFEASESLDLELIAGLEYNFDKNVNLMTVNFQSITVYIAGCPIVVTPVLEINAGIGGYANANITTSISQELSFDAGIEYNKGSGWSTDKSFDKKFAFSPPQLNVNAGAVAYLQPELIVKIYGVKGPYISARIYGKLEADLLQSPWWILSGGLDMSAGAKVKKFGKTFFDKHYDGLIKYEFPIAQSGSTPPGMPTVSTTQITNITETSATGGGNITDEGGFSIIARGVCWSDGEMGQTPTISDYKTTDGTGAGSFVSSISDLMANTTYYVRAYATNTNETTAYGSVMTFTTEDVGSNLPVLTTALITDITQTTAKSGGNITSDGGATVTARGVCWNSTGNPTISDNITTDGTGAGSFVSSISDLTANTTYYIRAYATNSNGTAYGFERYFTTEGFGNIVVTLDNVNPNIQANQTWTESGVILSLQEYNGHASFGIETEYIWLYPCMLHADLSGLPGTITKVEVDILDWCGTGCTIAKLFDGGVEIAQAGNTVVSGPSTLDLYNPGGYMPDVLTVSSLEGQVLEIRIIF